MTSLDHLRNFIVNRISPSSDLGSALARLGFVQADPIRSPARAQDLTLRHRVRGYRAGDLERAYATLPIEEDFFINYGFVTRHVQSLMHPRDGAGLLPTASNKRARAVLEFIRERGEVHPRDVDARFSHGTVVNYWGGSSSATTHLLENMHYKGWLRVARRDAGIRIYAVHAHTPVARDAATRRTRLDALVDVVVAKYAPIPAASLSFIVRRLRYAAPQWANHVDDALQHARKRLANVTIDNETWYWPADETAAFDEPVAAVRLLAPFDPAVWDRRRFEWLWGWPYRFEAYTPATKRRRGYYALPLLWRNRVIGWGNVSITGGILRADIGYVSGRAPRERGFKDALEAELARMRTFLS